GASGGVAAGVAASFQLADPARQVENLPPRRADLPDPAVILRGQANTLVLRATQTALTAAKGAGFLRQHPAQRWARQAMVFLVWSCPRPAAEATLAFLVNQEPIQSTTS